MERTSRDCACGRGVWRLSAAALGALMVTLSWWSIGAQTIPAQETPNGTYTLHVYTDLLQVPTVVLTRLHSNYRSLTSKNFTLILDGGPKFHPTNVRLQGDDPVTLAILFDFTTDADSMFKSLARVMSALPPGVFSARDYVSFYAYDCGLVRTTQDKPGTAEEMQASTIKLMTEGREQARNGAAVSCWSGKRLYDVVARVAQDIGELPGRRAILVVSDGADRHSVNDWLTVSRYAGSKSIAVFGLRPIGETMPAFTRRVNASNFNEGWLTAEEEDTFGKLCGSTGGLVLDADNSRKLLAGQMQRLMTTLRNRYIIEFPRPANGAAGYYSIEIEIGDPTAIIRPAGVSFPPRARDAKPEEGTLPSDESRMPLVGSKHEDVQPK